MAIFFTSDTHWHHANIIRYCNRPFSSVDEMDAELIRRHNAVVSDDDIVYNLGDIAWTDKPRKLAAILSQLNGTFRLMVGNHDRSIHKVTKQNSLLSGELFDGRKKVESIKIYDEIEIDGQMIVLCHYPMGAWNRAYRGSWMLHGHCHGTYRLGLPNSHKHGKIMDVGADCFDFAPVSYERVREIMEGIDRVTHRYNDGFTDREGNLLVRDAHGELIA
jgi:calcineurin-like phosphoesterase family protein